jgi:hypothetical protein
MFIGSAVSLGVVPNVIEKAMDSEWTTSALFCSVFLLMVAATIVGWNLQRERGLGVVIRLFPPEHEQEGMVRALEDASTENHSSTMSIKAQHLRLAGRELPAAARLDLVAMLIDARVQEHRRFGDDTAVTLYPSASTRDGFLLGQRLAAHAHSSLRVTHYSRGPDETVVPGVSLSSHLRNPLTAEQRTEISRWRTEPPWDTAPTIVEHHSCPPEHRHRLAFIVRIADAPTMLDDARHVAASGQVRRATDATHTGYVFDLEDFEATGPPCGAHAVFDTAPGHVPDEPRIFETMAAGVYETWVQARDAWKARSGLGHVAGQLFLNSPLAVTVALGWLMLHEDVQVVHHDRFLLNSRPPGA